MGDEDSEPQAVPLEVKVFTLQHLSGDDAMSVLNSLFAGSTTFSRVASQKTVIIAKGPAGALDQIAALLKTLDVAPPAGVESIEPVTLSQLQLAGVPGGDGPGFRDQHFDAFGVVEHGPFARMDANADNEPVHEAARALDHVGMAQRHGVE